MWKVVEIDWVNTIKILKKEFCSVIVVLLLLVVNPTKLNAVNPSTSEIILEM